MPQKPFLTARWEYLAMLNYEVDPAVLQPLVPAKTELDTFEGRTYASMVGFLFLDTRVLGWPVFFHRNFEEVNLRFYVRYKGAAGWRRGVVFVKEIVPRAAIAWIARNRYNEPYIALPMQHRIDQSKREGSPSLVRYDWMFEGETQYLEVAPAGAPLPLREGSEAAFIAEHYWGYTAQRDGGTLEYEVAHPPWRVWSVSRSTFVCNIARLYGAQFVEFLTVAPHSAFLAEGSAVTVFRGRRLS